MWAERSRSVSPPSNRVKVDPERESLSGMYEGAGYSTQQGVINIEVDRGAPPPRAMTEEECESHVVGGGIVPR